MNNMSKEESKTKEELYEIIDKNENLNENIDLKDSMSLHSSISQYSDIETDEVIESLSESVRNSILNRLDGGSASNVNIRQPNTISSHITADNLPTVPVAENISTFQVFATKPSTNQARVPNSKTPIKTVTSRRPKRLNQGIPVERITMSDVKGKDDGGITSDTSSEGTRRRLRKPMPSQVEKSILFIGAEASGKSSLALALTGTCFESVYGANSGTTDIRVFNGHFDHKGVDYGITVSDSVGQTGERGDDSSKLYSTFLKLADRVSKFDRIFVVLSFSSRKSLILIGVLDMIRDYLTEEAKERIYFAVTRVLPCEEETTIAMVKETVKGFGDISDRILCVDLPDLRMFEENVECTNLIQRRWDDAKDKLIDVITSDERFVLVRNVFKRYDIARDLTANRNRILIGIGYAAMTVAITYLAYSIYVLEKKSEANSQVGPGEMSSKELLRLYLIKAKEEASLAIGDVLSNLFW